MTDSPHPMKEKTFDAGSDECPVCAGIGLVVGPGGWDHRCEECGGFGIVNIDVPAARPETKPDAGASETYAAFVDWFESMGEHETPIGFTQYEVKRIAALARRGIHASPGADGAVGEWQWRRSEFDNWWTVASKVDAESMARSFIKGEFRATPPQTLQSADGSAPTNLQNMQSADGHGADVTDEMVNDACGAFVISRDIDKPDVRHIRVHMRKALVAALNRSATR